MNGSFVFSTNSRKTWARCLLNSLSNMADPNNILKAECYSETTAWAKWTCFRDVDKSVRCRPSAADRCADPVDGRFCVPYTQEMSFGSGMRTACPRLASCNWVHPDEER